MDNVKQRIKELCKAHGISVYKLEKETGIGNGVITKWDKYNPRSDKLAAVAVYFNVPIEALTGDKENPLVDDEGEFEDALSRERAQACFNIMRTLSPDDQKFALDFLKKLASAK